MHRTITYLLLSLVLADHKSIAQAQSKTMNTLDWGAATGGIQFRAVPTKTEFAVDEPVLVNLEVKTNGNRFFPLDENNRPIKEFQIMLTDSHGTAIPLTSYGKLVRAEPTFGIHDSYASRVVGVGPGQKLVFHFWINRMYDMTTPGNYHITFSRIGVVKAIIVSNSAVVKIVESSKFSSPKTNLDLPLSEPL